MTLLETFVWGFCGSVAVEVVALYHIFQSDPIKIPGRYKSYLYWFIRLCLAVIAGGLALAYKIDAPLLAANIGASTPLIIQAVSKGIKPPIQP